MNLLEEIVNYKKLEVSEKKQLYTTKLLEKSIYFNSPTVSITEYLSKKDKYGIIAEFKRKSPSKGYINKYASVENVSIGYMRAGASALSILTDSNFFGGSNDDLTEARKLNYCPILRKDFIIDEYQIIEAKSIGADAILLIAAILNKTSIRKLLSFASSLNLETIIEIHNANELNKLENIDNNYILGVNNRNLKNFKTSIENSINIADLIPKNILTISESGIKTPHDIITLKKHNYKGFLIGEQFMIHSRPELECKKFIHNLTKIMHNNNE